MAQPVWIERSSESASAMSRARAVRSATEQRRLRVHELLRDATRLAAERAAAVPLQEQRFGTWRADHHDHRHQRDMCPADANQKQRRANVRSVCAGSERARARERAADDRPSEDANVDRAVADLLLRIGHAQQFPRHALERPDSSAVVHASREAEECAERTAARLQVGLRRQAELAEAATRRCGFECYRGWASLR